MRITKNNFSSSEKQEEGLSKEKFSSVVVALKKNSNNTIINYVDEVSDPNINHILRHKQKLHLHNIGFGNYNSIDTNEAFIDVPE